MSDISREIEAIVLNVHRRNGGSLHKLDPALRLMDSKLGIDSLDLAEIVAEIEKRFHCSPFESSKPPRTWDEMIEIVQCGSR